MKKKIIYTMLALTLAIAMVAGGTMAWFTDEANAGDTTFTAGTLHVGVTEGLDSLITVAPNIDNMNPGDSYGPISIEITNEGTKKLAWFGNWIFTPVIEEGTEGDYTKLLDVIYIKTMSMQMLDADGNPWTDDPWYSGYNFIENGRGNFVGHNQSEANFYNSLADLSEFDVITLRNWNDNNSMITLADSPYEHMGALIGNSENKYVLTVELGFHQNAGNDYQGDAAGVAPIKVEFQVDATQVHEDAINHMNGLGTLHIGWLQGQIELQE
ncbi:TasA family protein [Alkaliphilus serpentinus]|uniref:Camelysin metallo-endopeptidase n=1 Tax=Alkaliphilus serpentinus TaxID=1482731 RepID=A0A833HQG7_9FIRM|nr:TasA family protein [Alkaliphilus serpentinus]KAB3531077.1 hypothetical protein F8153_05425 [Alkaliphilus serpentinus]